MEFESFAKIARLSRPCVVTEKIDGTNEIGERRHRKALRQRGRAVSDALEALLLAPFPGEDRARLLAQIEKLGLWVRSDEYRRMLDDYEAALGQEG